MPAPSVPLDAIRLPAFLYDADGRIVAATDLAEALAGRLLDGLAMAEVHAIFGHARQDGAPLLPADLPAARALSGEEVVAEPLVVTIAGGRTLDVLVTASPIRDGGAPAGAFVTWIDVTDRVRLEEGEARMRGLLDRNPCLVFLKDEEGRYVYLNETYKNQFVHREDWYGRTDLDFWPAESAELFRANDRDVLASGTTRQFLEDSTDRTGARYVWLNYKFPFTDATGRRYVGGIGIDATAFVRAEEALQRSQATLSAALASMTDAVAISDAGGGLVEVNDAFAAFHRFGSRDECLRTLAEYPDLLDVFLPDGTWVPPEMWVMPRALRGEAGINAEYTLRRKDTGEEWIGSYSYGPIRDGDGAVAGSVMVARDVTDRRRAEETIRRSEARFRGILDSSLDTLYRRDLVTGRFEYLSPAFERISGYPVEEALAWSADQVLDLIHPEDRPTARRRKVDDVDVTSQGTVDYRLRRPDGTHVWLSDRFRIIRDGEGRPVAREGIVRDISERKRIEEALRESEEMYRSLVDLSPDAIVVHRRGRILYANPAAVRLLRARDAPALLGTDILDLVHPDDRATGVQRIHRVQDRRGVTPLWEFRFLIDGETIDAEAVGGPVDWEGAPAVQVMMRDITRRRRAEEALLAALTAAREGEQTLAALMDSVPEGITIADADHRIRMVSRFGQELLGGPHASMTTGEVVERWRTFREDMATPLSEDELPLVRAIRSGATVRDAELVQVNEAGRALRLLCNAAPIRDADGAVTGGVVAWRDVSEQRRAEEALRESEEKYRRVFETMGEGFIIGELIRDGGGRVVDYRFLEANPAYERLTGFPRERSLSMTIRELIPDLEEAWIERHARVVETGEPLHWEQHNAATGGWYEVLSVPAGPERFASIFLNITDRKENDRALREYAENLARSNEDLERFAYVASHDLQEPLRSIVSFSQLLERKYRGTLDADADEYIGFIVEGGLRMQTLILDLLAYSRVNTTKQALTPTATGEVLAAVERNLAGQLTGAGATLTYGDMPMVIADPLQLEQVFANLVSNAIKFRREGLPLDIRISADCVDDMVEFSVRDNGIGIEQEYFDQIFVIFKRLHTKDAYPGTGIGLAIVKRIVDRHGGSVRVESVPGEGSTFYFTLPSA